MAQKSRVHTILTEDPGSIHIIHMVAHSHRWLHLQGVRSFWSHMHIHSHAATHTNTHIHIQFFSKIDLKRRKEKDKTTFKDCARCVDVCPVSGHSIKDLEPLSNISGTQWCILESCHRVATGLYNVPVQISKRSCVGPITAGWTQWSSGWLPAALLPSWSTQTTSLSTSPS